MIWLAAGAAFIVGVGVGNHFSQQIILETIKRRWAKWRE